MIFFCGSLWVAGAAAKPEPTLLPVRAGGYYFDGASLNVRQIIPPPPARGSALEKREIEAVLEIQAARTAADVASAEAAEQDTLFDNASVLGSWFNERNLPVTMAFFAKVDADVYAVRAKEIFKRSRPSFVDARVHPCVRVSDSPAYPSGHAVRAWVWAALLTEIFPDQGVQLAARAEAVSRARVVGGVHFPSDIVAGQALAKVMVQELLKNPAVRAEIEKCREEAKSVALKKAA